MLRIKTNLVGGIFTLAIAVGLLLLVPSQIQIGASAIEGHLAADSVPRMVLILMIVLSVMLILESLVLKREHIVEIEIKQLKSIAVFTGILFLGVILFYVLGFLVSMFVMCGLIFLRLKCKERKLYIVCAVLIILVYIIFTEALNVRLP